MVIPCQTQERGCHHGNRSSEAVNSYENQKTKLVDQLVITFVCSRGNTENFFCSYRTREEVQQVRKTRDPITGFKDKIITAGLVTEDELKAIDKEAKTVVSIICFTRKSEYTVKKSLSGGLYDQLKIYKFQVDAAVKVAHEEEALPPEALYCDLYHNTPPQVVRGSTIDESVLQPYLKTAEVLKKLGVNA